MKLKEINECMNQAKRDVGDALIASVISNIENGTALVKHNCDEKLGAYSAQTITFLKDVVQNDNQKLGRYMYAEVNDQITGLFIIMGEYVWNITFDHTKMPLGMLVNVYLDDLIESFRIAAV